MVETPVAFVPALRPWCSALAQCSTRHARTQARVLLLGDVARREHVRVARREGGVDQDSVVGGEARVDRQGDLGLDTGNDNDEISLDDQAVQQAHAFDAIPTFEAGHASAEAQIHTMRTMKVIEVVTHFRAEHAFEQGVLRLADDHLAAAPVRACGNFRPDPVSSDDGDTPAGHQLVAQRERVVQRSQRLYAVETGARDTEGPRRRTGGQDEALEPQTAPAPDRDRLVGEVDASGHGAEQHVDLVEGVEAAGVHLCDGGFGRADQHLFRERWTFIGKVLLGTHEADRCRPACCASAFSSFGAGQARADDDQSVRRHTGRKLEVKLRGGACVTRLLLRAHSSGAVAAT